MSRRAAHGIVAALTVAVTVALTAPVSAATPRGTSGSERISPSATSVVEAVSGGAARILTAPTQVDGLRVAPATVDGRPVSTIVSPAQDGVALAAVLQAGQSRVDFPDPLPAGRRLVPTPEGGFDVRQDGRRVGSVAPPWALDAAGRALPTRYEVRADGGITQLVDTRGASFPVVADPKYSLGFYRVPVWYVEYYWSEMWRAKLLMDKYGKPTSALVSFLCAYVPSAPAKAVCAYMVNSRYGTLAAQVNYGIANKRCLKVRNGFGVADFFVFKAWTKTCIK